MEKYQKSKYLKISFESYLRSGAIWQLQFHGLLKRVRLVMVLNWRLLGIDFSLLFSR